MGAILKEETVKFVNKAEYENVKYKLENAPKYESIKEIIKKYDDATFEISYETEEIVPKAIDEERTKVLLLFKNPHPDSVQAGLYLSELSSKTFWNRFFEVKFNEKLLPLLEKDSWIKDVAETLTSGNYNSQFLYYFKCLYPFPSRQFNELTGLFSSAPNTYKQEIEKQSTACFWEFLENHEITNVIVFFIDGMRTLAGIPSVSSKDVINGIKTGIDKYICDGSSNNFWQLYKGLKVKSPEGITFYFNMNTRTKNHGSHLPKRYFTYNLEFILQDMLEDQQKGE
jgi:hypothetical protein